MLALMDGRPAAYIMDAAYEELRPEDNVHRTFFNANLQHWLRGLRRIFKRYGTVEGLARERGVSAEPAPAWALAKEINIEVPCSVGETAQGRLL